MLYLSVLGVVKYVAVEDRTEGEVVPGVQDEPGSARYLFHLILWY